MLLASFCSCLCPIQWSQVFSREWRCSWSSADRLCSSYIWVINNFIAYQGAPYMRDLTVTEQMRYRVWPIICAHNFVVPVMLLGCCRSSDVTWVCCVLATLLFVHNLCMLTTKKIEKLCATAPELAPSMRLSGTHFNEILIIFDLSSYYSNIIMGAMASQITSLTIIYSIVYSGADQRKHQSAVSLVFVRGIHQWPANSRANNAENFYHLMTALWISALETNFKEVWIKFWTFSLNVFGNVICKMWASLLSLIYMDGILIIQMAYTS